MSLGFFPCGGNRPRRRRHKGPAAVAAEVLEQRITLTAYSFGVSLAGTAQAGASTQLVGDFNADHQDDLACFSTTTAAWQVYLSGGQSGLVDKGIGLRYGVGTNWQVHLAADFDSDGAADVASFHAPTRTWWVSLADGAGRFGEPTLAQRYAIGGWGFHQAADFTGDGRADLLSFHSPSGGWWLSASDGAGGFAAPQLARWYGTGQGWQTHLTADLNGDSRTDLLSFHIPTRTWWASLADGLGAFAIPQVAQRYAVGEGWQTHTTADVSGDGRADLLSFRSPHGQWWVSEGDAAGGFKAPRLAGTYATGLDWQTHLAADFNADGRSDVASFHAVRREWWVSLAATTGTFAAPRRWAAYAPNTAWLGHVAGYFNGDMKADLTSLYSGRSVWLAAAKASDALRLSLSPAVLQEDRQFTLTIAGGQPNQTAQVALLHDGAVVHSFGSLTLLANGTASLTAALPTGLVPAGANRDGFELKVIAGERSEALRITVLKQTQVSLDRNRIQEDRHFLLRVDRGKPSSEIKVELWHDGALRHQFDFEETNADGNAELHLLVPKGLITGAAAEDGFEVRVLHDDKPWNFPITVVKETEVLLSSDRGQEGRQLTVFVRRGIPRSLVDIDILHDGSVVHEYGFLETDDDGNADLPLFLPLGLVPDGHSVDGFEFRVRHGGVDRLKPLAIDKETEISLPSGTTLREGDTFTLNVERGIGESSVDVEILHEGEIVHVFSFRETGSDGRGSFILDVPRGLITSDANQDGFELRVAHAGIVRTFRVTIERGLTVRLSASSVEAGKSVNVNVQRGVGQSQVKIELFRDGVRIDHDFGSTRQTNGSGEYDSAVEIPGNLREDFYELVVEHGGLRFVFGLTITEGETSPGPSQEKPPQTVNPPSGTPPTSPGPLTAIAQSSARVDLSWNNSSGENEYRIYRATTSDFSNVVLIDIVGVNVTSYSDTKGLSPGKTYYYEVHAVGLSIDLRAKSERKTVSTPTVPSNVNDFIRNNTPAPVAGSGWIHVHGSGQHKEFSSYDHTHAVDLNLNIPTHNSDSGRPVVAALAGRLVFIDETRGHLILRHQINGITWFTEYMHMNVPPQTYNRFRNGQPVDFVAGEQIGAVGRVGTTTEHLHFAISVMGVGTDGRTKFISIDLAPWLSRNGIPIVRP